jgi:hypothetical protein
MLAPCLELANDIRKNSVQLQLVFCDCIPAHWASRVAPKDFLVAASADRVSLLAALRRMVHDPMANRTRAVLAPPFLFQDPARVDPPVRVDGSGALLHQPNGTRTSAGSCHRVCYERTFNVADAIITFVMRVL